MLWRPKNLLLTAALMAVACAQGTPAEEPVDSANNNNLRSESGGGPGPAPGSPEGGEAPEDEEPTNIGLDPDTEPDNSMMSGGCPVNACDLGDTKCVGPDVSACEEDGLNTGCGVWGPPSACAGVDEACVAGACVVPMGCVDADGDGYGVMCAAGADCDDDDAAVYAGAAEICDDVDNDCDGMVDEGFQLGMACTYGGGSCQADGTIVCGPDGGTICSGMAVGTPEVCDGADNDCNGIVDDGVCGVCQSDIFEPNDAMSSATPIQVDAPTWAYTCPGDTDWFELETQTGVTYHIYVTFPEERSDLLVRGYVDGVNVITGDTVGRDYEEFVVNGDANKAFHIEVEDRDGIESWFYVSLVADWNCGAEDGFVPNQTIQTAPPFPPYWLTTVYMCPGARDWYYLGELQANDPLYVGILGDIDDTDLDLFLWGDPDGDNNFERLESSADFTSFEEIDIMLPHTGHYYVEVVDFDGQGGEYDIGWEQ